MLAPPSGTSSRRAAADRASAARPPPAGRTDPPAHAQTRMSDLLADESRRRAWATRSGRPAILRAVAVPPAPALAVRTSAASAGPSAVAAIASALALATRNSSSRAHTVSSLSANRRAIRLTISCVFDCTGLPGKRRCQSNDASTASTARRCPSTPESVAGAAPVQLELQRIHRPSSTDRNASAPSFTSRSHGSSPAGSVAMAKSTS